MKRIVLMKKVAILLLMIITFAIFFSSYQVKAINVEDVKINLEDNIPEEKIMKYDRRTNEITEVDMDELIKSINSSVNRNDIPNYTNLDSNEENDSSEPLRYVGNVELVSNPSSAPYKYVCRIRATKNGSGFTVGTAALVGNKAALTAAHCVFDLQNNNQVFQNWTIYPGYGGGNWCGTATGWDTVYYSSSYFNASSIDRYKYDWAICVLQADESSVGHFGVTTCTDTSLSGMSIKVYGYPSDENIYSFFTGATQYQSTGTVQNVETTAFKTNAFLCHGFSGGPTVRASDNCIVGVANAIDQNNGTNSYSARITQNMINIITSINNSN